MPEAIKWRLDICCVVKKLISINGVLVVLLIAMSFSGFSEDDIRKLRTTDGVNKSEAAPPKAAVKKVTFKPNNVRTSETRSKKILNNTTNNIATSNENMPENAKLTPVENAKLTPVVNEIIEALVHSPITSPHVEDNVTKVAAEQTKVVEVEKKYVDLDDFEARQKLIEEQNRKRKELLSKALADRTKQTQEEAHRLGEIQEEFRKLDAVLSNDVKILRKQIEVASLDYTDCQKRYHKIEKDFLEAKVALHQKLEKKEMLTEHLCAIIEKNEERKAEKLDELLRKLQVTPELENSAKSKSGEVVINGN